MVKIVDFDLRVGSSGLIGTPGYGPVVKIDCIRYI